MGEKIRGKNNNNIAVQTVSQFTTLRIRRNTTFKIN